jgi:formate-dependent nitrite reductase cytochrome c552 subunit
MSEQETLATNTATEAVDTQEQAATGKTYTQEEFDNHMAGLKASLQKKLLKPYEDLGDVNELRALKEQAAKKAQEESLKRGEFEKILQEMAAKKDEEIKKRDSVIREYKIEAPLINAAAKYRAVAPEQVRALLKSNVNLNEEGEVEVLDAEGKVRYNDAGQPYQVEDLVKEWLDSNPHFVAATPSTSSTKSSISANQTALDITKLDMKNPEHRKVYAEYRKTQGIR